MTRVQKSTGFAETQYGGECREKRTDLPTPGIGIRRARYTRHYGPARQFTDIRYETMGGYTTFTAPGLRRAAPTKVYGPVAK